MEWFWQFVESLDQRRRVQLLFWITGWKSLPPAGFKGMPRPFCIEITPPSDRLPGAHTCAFQLDLPRYESYEVLAAKLAEAMTHLEFALA